MAFVISAAVINGISSNSSAGKAADAQTEAARMASDTQLKMYNQTRDDQAPYRQAGTNALSQLSAGTADGGQLTKQYDPYHAFNADDLKSNLAPNYDFMLQQGLGAVNNQATVGGGLVGGNALKGINDYAQNYAKGAYQDAFDNYNSSYYTGFNANQTQQSNIFNRLSSIAGLGQTANGTLATAGINYAGNIGSAQLASGRAQSSGIIAGNNALTGGLNNAASWYQSNGGGSQGANNLISNINPFSSANQYYGSTGTDANGYTTSSTGAYTG